MTTLRSTAIVVRHVNRRHPRGAMILIYTLLVLGGFIAALFAFSEWMVLEYRATRATTHQIRTTLIAEGAVDWAIAQLQNASSISSQRRWTDASGESILVDFIGGAPGTPWASVRQPLNEGAKLNLNSLDLSPDAQLQSRQRLLMIPGMDTEVADSILDWLDDDDEPRQFGAESNWYVSSGRRARSDFGPVTDLQQLLQVRGVTIRKLYGEDVNGNGWLDLNEDDGARTLPADHADGRLDAGWSQWLTVLSKESHLDQRDNPKINLNQTDLVRLYRQVEAVLGGDGARYVVALRMNGPLDDLPESQLSGPETIDRRREQAKLRAIEQTRGTLSFNRITGERFGDFAVDRPGVFTIRSLADLIGHRVEIMLDSQYTIVRSPWTGSPSQVMKEWDWLQAHFCLDEAAAQPGRIHLGYADRTVLMTIPGMTLDLAHRIELRQQSNRSHVHENEAWLVAENALSLDQFRRLAPYITCRGDVYSGISIGSIDDQPHRYAVSFIFDVSGRTPKICRLERHIDRPVPASWSVQP